MPMATNRAGRTTPAATQTSAVLLPQLSGEAGTPYVQSVAYPGAQLVVFISPSYSCRLLSSTPERLLGCGSSRRYRRCNCTAICGVVVVTSSGCRRNVVVVVVVVVVGSGAGLPQLCRFVCQARRTQNERSWVRLQLRGQEEAPRYPAPPVSTRKGLALEQELGSEPPSVLRRSVTLERLGTGVLEEGKHVVGKAAAATVSPFFWQQLLLRRLFAQLSVRALQHTNHTWVDDWFVTEVSNTKRKMAVCRTAIAIATLRLGQLEA